MSEGERRGEEGGACTTLVRSLPPSFPHLNSQSVGGHIASIPSRLSENEIWVLSPSPKILDTIMYVESEACPIFLKKKKVGRSRKVSEIRIFC